MANLNKLLLIFVFLCSSCSLTHYAYKDANNTLDPVYEDYSHTTKVYYHVYGSGDRFVYFGYWDGFYYYYGVPHFYPWWYYYQFIPPYHYYTHSHIHVHCSNGYYVHHGHRKNRFNNQEGKDYNPTISLKTKNIKTNTFPRDWKSSNSTRINKQNELKYNINKQNYNRTFNGNFNKSYNKRNNTININKNNTINKGNNGSKRSNKTTTTRKPKK